MTDGASPFLYLTTTGRKTGLPRRIEIWYVEIDSCFYLISELRERADWVRNLLANPTVTFEVACATGSARARIVDPVAEPALAAAVCAAFDGAYGWSNGTLVELAPIAPAAGPVPAPAGASD